MRGYLPFFPRGTCYSHAWSCTLCEWGTSFYKGRISRNLDRLLCIILTGFHSVSYLFFSIDYFLLLVEGFDGISCNIDEVLSSNPLAKVFVFGDFNVCLKNWLTYSEGSGRPSKLCYNFSFSNNLAQMINFSTGILDCDSHSDASIFSTVAFPPLGNSDLVVISVSLDCPSNPKGMPLFIAQLMAFISIVFSCLSCCHSS